jgi:hypothetical protein
MPKVVNIACDLSGFDYEQTNLEMSWGGGQGFQAVRTLLLTPKDGYGWMEFSKALLGWSTLGPVPTPTPTPTASHPPTPTPTPSAAPTPTPTYSGDILTNHLPHGLPEWSAIPVFSITSIRGSHASRTHPSYAQSQAWDKYEFVVVYKLEGNKVDNTGQVTYASETIEPTAEFLTLPTTGLYWDESNTLPLGEQEAPGFLMRGFDYVYRIEYQEEIPAEALSLGGCVNNAAVISPVLGMTFAAGTLLFQPPTFERAFNSGNNIPTWTITYRMTYKAVGWNNFPHVVDGELSFDPIYDDTGAVDIYPTGDFSVIFLTDFAW